MTGTDRGLDFWLRYVEHRGGLAEPSADGALVVLSEAMATEFDLPEETVVTADPDVAREDATLLLATGHPVLVQAADGALSDGDAGVLALAGPHTPAPGRDWCQEALRDRIQVDHGRIEVTGQPARIDRPVLRVGALVTYTVSAEETYQERLECWVDGSTGLELGAADIARLRRAPSAEQPVAPRSATLAHTAATVDAAHALLEDAAGHRRRALADQATDGHRRERSHARDYYADVLRSLDKRRIKADPERAALLAARADSTRAERDRRLLEIDEKYQAGHEIRPFRLHAVMVPGWRVPVDVCRGPRRYPLAFDWLPALSAFATQRCPHCGAPGTLCAGKSRLGCRSCLQRT